MVEAFIFDVDGTLADTERDGHRVAFNQAFERFGLDWYWDEVTYGSLLPITGGKERMRYFAETQNKPEKNRNDLDDLIKRVHAYKNEIYASLLINNKIGLRPGVKRLLNESRQEGIRLAIATTTTPTNVTALLSNALGPDSLNWFEVIGAGDMVTQKKPAPDIYNYVVKELELKPDQCLAFEDSISGIRSSTAAGLKTVITYNDYTRHDDFNSAILVLDHLGDDNQPSSQCRQQLSCDYLDLAHIQQLV